MEGRMWEDRILMDREEIISTHDTIQYLKKIVSYKSKTSGDDEDDDDVAAENMQIPKENINFMKVSEVQSTEQTTEESKKTSSEAEGQDSESTCVASGLEYCQSCLTGPQCCVDLTSPDPEDDPEPSEAASTHHSHDSDSGGESVISFYLGKRNDQELSVVEYEFYVDEDDGNIEGYEYKSFHSSEEEDIEYLTEDVKNAVETYDYQLTKGDKYVTDDANSRHDSGPSLPRGPKLDSFSYYQEPLEVILEILGEEGEDEAAMQSQSINNHRVSREDKEEDMITFLSSVEFTPSSNNEPRIARDIVIHQGLSDSSDTSPSTFSQVCDEHPCDKDKVSRQTVVDRAPPVCSGPVIQGRESPSATVDNMIDCNADSLGPSRSYITGGEGSDAQKLRSLTSEIECYLRETTKLLESVSTYTKVPPANRNEAELLHIGQINPNCKSCLPQETNNFQDKIICSKNYSEAITSSSHTHDCVTTHQTVENVENLNLRFGLDVENLCCNIQNQFNLMVKDVEKTGRFGENSLNHQPPQDDQRHWLDINNCEGTQDGAEWPKMNANNITMRSDADITEDSTFNCTSREERNCNKSAQGNSFHYQCVLDGITGEVRDQDDSEENPILQSENHEVFQTLVEVRNSVESRHVSAVAGSVDAVDVLEWEENNREKQHQQHSQKIYKLADRSQEEDYLFTSLDNTQEDYWMPAIDDHEISVDVEDTDSQDVSHAGEMSRQSLEIHNPSPTAFTSPDYENIFKGGTSSRSDSPPPTVPCLDNLEKMYRRLSQEYETHLSSMCITEPPVTNVNCISFNGISKAISDTKNNKTESYSIEPLREYICEKEHLCKSATVNSMREVQNSELSIIRGEDEHKANSDYDNRNTRHKDLVSKENGPCFRMRENVETSYNSRETQRVLDRSQICTKLDDIFIKAESDISTNICSEDIVETVGSLLDLKDKTVIPATTSTSVDDYSCHADHAEIANIQLQLNEILSGIDVMYDNYMEKNRKANYERCTYNITNKTKLYPTVQSEMNTTENNEALHTVQHNEKHNTSRRGTEKSSFQDIINISEDLKHICVFHVNKSVEGVGSTTLRDTKEGSWDHSPKMEVLPEVGKESTPGRENQSTGGPADQEHATQNHLGFTPRCHSALRPGHSGSPEGQGVCGRDLVTFLATIREENRECYAATAQYLERLLNTTLLPPDMNMSALQLAAEGRDYLMWCPDQEFDNAVSALDIRGLVELVQTLQDAMAVEQQTFDSLSQQLELVHDPLQQQRLSAALCTSQTRLARLCSRNMRCFRQQALKVRHKESSESRSSSPRDSGLTVSSAAASDTEGDPRSPAGPSFRNSLAFFQRAAHLVANNAKNTSLGARQKDTRRRSSRGSSCYGSSSSEAWSVASDDQAADFSHNITGLPDEGADGYEDDFAATDDPGTYEQVLFINGRPQYQDDLSWSGKRSRSNSWTVVSVDGSSGNCGAAAGPDHQPLSVPHTSAPLPGRPAAPAHSDTANVAAAEAHTQTLDEDVASYVTLPRRKPYLNFKSVSSSTNSNSSGVSDYDHIKEKLGLSKNSALNTLTRAQSFKEGLNCYTNDYNNTSGLSRTQSFNDGLASDFNELGSSRAKLQRAPSVDEILESVKYLRAKKTMVKSNPDLVSVQEPVYSSASLPRHKSSKGKAPRVPGTSSLLGVKYNGHSNPHYERVPEPDYEQIPESTTPAYYENVCKGNNHYENIGGKGEVIYDSPRPTNSHHYDKVHNDLHYENVKYDAPVYENLDEKEPTYMNVNDSGGKSNVYTSAEAIKKTGSLKSLKSRANKVTVSGNSTLQGATYDVPRAATHIYDSPQKQVRSVGATQSNEYDTPKNNRSVLPQSTQIVLKAKNDQKKKIDDIFADCDQDSLEGDRDRGPDIPSPDYGSEEEEDGFQHATNDYVTTELPDEGLGESDTRLYYTEDPAGLEVILEEPEEEYCSSHASEDYLQREVDITYELKGERRSLDGSEGIGSAEGDTQSSGGSEHYGEEDCASSGIHSEDTPSPGPPVDSEKDATRQPHKQKREEDRTQKDRCVEVYPETVRQRQRKMMAAANKVDIKNWSSSGGNNNNSDTLSSPAKVKKFLPSVKALRSQFEAGKTNNNNRQETNGNVVTNGSNTGANGSGTTSLAQSRKSSSSTSSLASSTLEKTSSTNSLISPSASVENLVSPQPPDSVRHVDHDDPVEPIYNQFQMVDEELKELMSKPPSTLGWNPRSLLKRLYYIPEAPRMQSQGTTYINIEGYLEKLPSGRKKATFWNAWKRRYFVAKDGVLYYYQGTQTEKPSMKMTLMGGRVECMEPNMVGVDDGSRDTKASSMLGIDDGKGHYVVVRCSSRQEAERWRRALETHTVEDFASQYVQPWPIPTNPTLLRDILVIDIGSASIRAGVLASQATLPQLFMPTAVANSRDGRRQVWGFDALAPEVRSTSSVGFPIRPSHKISKYSVDLSAVSSILQKTFADLKVDPKNYHIQLSVPRVLNTNTQAELLRVLFDKHGVRSINLTHQSILALYAYNATSGIVVDVGERMDIVPVIDGYIVDGGVSRVPYGGYRILDHLRQFLYMRNVSLINEVESYIIRHVLENICYCAHHYNTEKARCTTNSDTFEKSVPLSEYFSKECPYESISLDFGRFQATEGLFNPDAWGLDHPGLHKLVHKAIMECSMDIRKEMSRSIFLAGGVTQLPGLVDRLTTEIDNLTPPAIRPKVHASPYRYHAAYIGACILAESPAFTQSRIMREDWNKYGNVALRKWSL